MWTIIIKIVVSRQVGQLRSLGLSNAVKIDSPGLTANWNWLETILKAANLIYSFNLRRALLGSIVWIIVTQKWKAAREGNRIRCLRLRYLRRPTFYSHKQARLKLVQPPSLELWRVPEPRSEMKMKIRNGKMCLNSQKKEMIQQNQKSWHYRSKQ